MAYGTWRFYSAFTRALQYLSWAESTQFLILIPISLRSILIFSSHLCLGLPKGLFPVGVPLKLLKHPTFLNSGYMICPSESFRLNYPDYIKWTVQTINFLIVETSPLPICNPIEPKVIILIIIIIIINIIIYTN